MNCITVMEPHASALVFGMQDFEERPFRIKNGKCAIHVSKKASYTPKKLNEYYRSIGADITADICLIVFNKKENTDTVHVVNGEIRHKIDFDENSNDAKLAKTLFERNASAQNGSIFLTGQIIGEINIEKNIKLKNNLFANYYSKGKLYSLKESIFIKGQRGQFKIKE